MKKNIERANMALEAGITYGDSNNNFMLWIWREC